MSSKHKMLTILGTVTILAIVVATIFGISVIFSTSSKKFESTEEYKKVVKSDESTTNMGIAPLGNPIIPVPLISTPISTPTATSLPIRPTATPLPVRPTATPLLVSPAISGFVPRSFVDSLLKLGERSDDEVKGCIKQLDEFKGGNWHPISIGETIEPNYLVATNFYGFQEDPAPGGFLTGKHYAEFKAKPICKVRDWGVFETTQQYKAPYPGSIIGPIK
jgi:hypothetical protein